MTQLPFEDLHPLWNPEPIDSRKAFETGFERFWEKYPRKVGKRRARTAFNMAWKRAQFSRIMDGLARYVRNKPDYCDWMHPTTFLNGDHWEDEYGVGPQFRGCVHYNGEALEIIADHAKQPWCERGKYTRDVLQQCVDAGLLTVGRMEDVL